MQSHSIVKLNIKKNYLMVDFYLEHIGNITLDNIYDYPKQHLEMFSIVQ
jgi:hypothetical protein